MENTNLDTSRGWGMTYLIKNGIAIVSSNLDEIPPEWIVRCYYKDNHGNIYMNGKKGRQFCMDFNDRNNTDLFYLKKYVSAINLEIKGAENLQKVLSDLEKSIN
jgi:hypothetical protein